MPGHERIGDRPNGSTADPCARWRLYLLSLQLLLLWRLAMSSGCWTCRHGISVRGPLMKLLLLGVSLGGSC